MSELAYIVTDGAIGGLIDVLIIAILVALVVWLIRQINR